MDKPGYLGRNTRNSLMSSSSLAHWAVLAAAMVAVPAHAGTLPTGGSVAAGNASIATNATTTSITQTSNRAVINWDSFSVGNGNSVTFAVPDASGATLNRVTGATTSTIAGQISSNGAVYLINPNGIAITSTGTVQTAGGFVASSLDLADADFMAGRTTFTGKGASAQVSNAGSITAGQGAYVALLGGAVSNSGTINVPLGKFGMGSGEQIALDINGGAFMQVAVPTALVVSSGGLVDNSGAIVVTGGSVQLSAATLKSAVRNVINMSGSISADNASGNGGIITLSGGDGGGVQLSGKVSATGSAAGGQVSLSGDNITNTGVIDASGSSAGGSVNIVANNLFASGSTDASSASGNGGSIVLTASNIDLIGASYNASGLLGGGSIKVGGDYHGGGAVAHASNVFVSDSTVLDASATGTGKGGEIVVWSDVGTTFYGTASARGGANGGDGGAIEISSAQKLIMGGLGDAGANAGAAGYLVLDPQYIVIDNTKALYPSYQLVDPDPSSTNNFGSTTMVLAATAANGTVTATNSVLVSSPGDSAGGSNAGAWYVFNRKTGALISAFTGSAANDAIGNAYVTQLSNGNFLLIDSGWQSGKGFVAFGSATTGLSGVVGANNALIGSNSGDYVGGWGVNVDSVDGSYIVRSPYWNGGTGAVTWGSSTSGVTGVVSSANSLVGSNPGDFIGNSLYQLSNGNWLVNSSSWNNSAGAVTFVNGATGLSGVVSASNSLVGSNPGDYVGSNGYYTLANGNYVVISPNWNGSMGAVTWGSGTSGVTGVVSSANSLVGSTAGDYVGSNGLYTLSNGGYLVLSPNWNSSTGAITWSNGTSALVGTVSASNSLVGAEQGDQLGSYNYSFTEIYANDASGNSVSNGNFLIWNPSWNNSRGMVAWGSGTAGISGVLSSSTALIGSNAGDAIGNNGIQQLPNGNYLVVSPNWNSSAGAVTWGNANSGVSGEVSSTNSLVGSNPNDLVGNNGINMLPNGNYVVFSPNWSNNTGAVTWGSGTTGVSGTVSANNSLVGSNPNDYVGSNGIATLTNGNYVVLSPNWSNSAGAVTWGSSTSGVSGVVSANNSLVGSNPNDQIGIGGVYALSNGNYVVDSSNWNGYRGAVTWGNGTSGVSGAVSASYSLVGSQTGDFVGDYVSVLSNGNYVVGSPNWSNRTGAATWGNGATGVSGEISANNSLVGSTAGDSVGGWGVDTLSNGNYVVVSPNWNGNFGAVTWGNGTSGVSGVVSANNSLVGSNANDYVGNWGINELSNGNYVVISPSWNGNFGAVTWGNGATGVSGTVSSANSLVGSTSGDTVGGDGIYTINNGSYLVRSSNWNGGTGAITWSNGTSPLTGVVSSANSLVGASTSDNMGGENYQITTIYTGGEGSVQTGNFLIVNPYWNSNRGMVAWGSGTNGISGVVSSANALIGSNPGDYVGGVVQTTVYYRTQQPYTYVNTDYEFLPNGNYLVFSPQWNNGAGAVTFGNGATGISGVVSSSNSLVGATAGDHVGMTSYASGRTNYFYTDMLVLSTGDYLIGSPSWNGFAGAVTWGSGTTGVTGVVSAANSLVGSNPGDMVGASGNYSSATNYYTNSTLQDLGGGAWSATSPNWNGGTGAVTVSGGGAVAGVLSSSNSLLGNGGQAYLAGCNGGGMGELSFKPAGMGNYGNSCTLAADGSFVVADSGANGGMGVVYVGLANPAALTYARAANQTVTLSTSVLTNILQTGTALSLQANDDITVNSAITVSGSTGGALSLSAGRSIFVNANITTANGKLTLLANDSLANGVVDADRSVGNAVITMAPGTVINTGTADFVATIAAGTDKTNSATGAITLGTIDAAHITVENAGLTSGSDVVLASGATLATSATSGTAIALASDNGTFTNQGATLSLANGSRFVVFADAPANVTLGTLPSYGHHYNVSTATYQAGKAPVGTSGNYVLYRYQPTATVTYTATPVSAVYGQGLPALTGTVSATGLLAGDTLATLGTVNWTTNATASSVAGSYAINGATISSGEYKLNVVEAVANATALTITSSGQSLASFVPQSGGTGGVSNGSSAGSSNTGNGASAGTCTASGTADALRNSGSALVGAGC